MISPNFVGIGGKKYFGHFTNAPPIIKAGFDMRRVTVS
jgi:hypothetical protein